MDNWVMDNNEITAEARRLMGTIEKIRRQGGGAKWIEAQTLILLENALKEVRKKGFTAGMRFERDER